MGPPKHAEFGLGPRVGVLLEGLKQGNDLYKEATLQEICLRGIEPQTSSLLDAPFHLLPPGPHTIHLLLLLQFCQDGP